MNNRRNKIFSHAVIICLFLQLACLSWNVRAAGPLPEYVNENGVPAVWDSAATIQIDLDPGSCAGSSNATMITRVTDDLAVWENVADAILDFDIVTTSIPADVTGDNFSPLYLDISAETDGLNPLIFDDDGSITSAMNGIGQEFSILGFAAPVSLSEDGTQILEGASVMNCLCIDNDYCGALDPDFVVSNEALDFIITHEFGHFLNLDHTQVNQALADAPCDENVVGDCADVPMMFTWAFDPFEAADLARDDEVSLLTLYGTAGWDSGLCTVTGSLIDTANNAVPCVDIQATTGDTADTISAETGSLAAATDNNGDGDKVDDGECSGFCGYFELRGLDPNKDYTITAKPIDPEWLEGSSVGPCYNEQPEITEQELGTVTGGSDCVAGGTVDLGDMTLGDEGDGGADDDGGDDGDGGDSGGSSGVACGEGQDFSNCNPLISCSLKRTDKSANVNYLFCLFFLNIAVPIFLMRRKSRGVSLPITPLFSGLFFPS